VTRRETPQRSTKQRPTRQRPTAPARQCRPDSAAHDCAAPTAQGSRDHPRPAPT
jgi:hypothetical protein